MLVSTIARFNALNTMNNAAFASMQSSNLLLNAVSSCGNNNLYALNEMDKKISSDMLTNNLLYKIASLQEKTAAQQTKNSLNLLA